MSGAGFRPPLSRKLRPERGYEGLGDFPLNTQNVTGIALENIRPDTIAVGRVIQVHGHPHPAGRSSDAALQHAPHIKFAPDFADVEILAFELKCGSARDDAQARNAAQRGDQLIGKAVAKLFVIFFAAQIDEGQNHKRSRVGRSRSPKTFRSKRGK